MTQSNWEASKAKSQYHFDSTRPDGPPYVMENLGQLTPTWATDLNEILAGAKPATWATRGYKGEGVTPPSEDLASEEYDLEAAGYGKDYQITHLNWELPKSLQDIADNFGLEDCMSRIHVQMPGEVWNLHIDKLYKWAPDNPDSVMRIFIQLTDWQPGQFWEYGNYHWNQWRAGSVTTFNWRDIPHSTANAGFHPRVTFQLTGIKTDKTQNMLDRLANHQ